MARSFELWSIEFAAPIFGCEGSWQKIQFAPPSYLGSEFLLGRRGTWVSSGHSFNLRSRRTMSDNSRNLFFWLSRLPERRRRTEGKEAQSFSFQSIWLSFGEIPSGSHSGGIHITDSIWLSFEKIPSVSPSGRFHLLSFGEIPSGPPSGRFHLALLQGDFIWLPLSRIPFNRFHLAFLREDSMCSPSRRFHLNLLRWDSICLSFGRFHLALLWGDSIWLSFREIPSGSHSGRYHLALLHGEIPSGSHLGGYCIWLSFAQIPSGPPSE